MALARAANQFKSPLISLCRPANISKVAPAATRAVSTWEDVASTPLITSAVLPYSEMNWPQVVLAPITYPMMYSLDFLSGYCPWYLTIVATTIICRTFLAPVSIKQMKMGTMTHNVQPDMQRLQKKVNEAMFSGSTHEKMVAQVNMQNFLKKNGMTMWDRFKPIIYQAPVFCSMFMLLRKLANYPLAEFHTGGIAWFTDLTLPDPYYVLPLVSGLSTYLTLKFGSESISAEATPGARVLVFGLPVVIFAVTCQFPSALLVFWATNNLFSLGFASLMRTAFMKKKFNMPEKIKHDPKDLPLSNLSFKQMMSESYDKAKASATTTTEMRRLDDLAFRKAGMGPLTKTYKERPKIDKIR